MIKCIKYALKHYNFFKYNIKTQCYRDGMITVSIKLFCHYLTVGKNNNIYND